MLKLLLTAVIAFLGASTSLLAAPLTETELIAAFRSEASSGVPTASVVAPTFSLVIYSQATGCVNCELLKLEVSKNPKLPACTFVYDETMASVLGVTGFPTTFVYKDGKLVDRIRGYSKGLLESRLKLKGWKE